MNCLCYLSNSYFYAPLTKHNTSQQRDLNHSVDTVSCYMNGYMVPFYDDVQELCDGFAAMSDAVHIGDSFPFEYGGTGGEGYKKGIVARAVAANGGGGEGKRRPVENGKA